MSTKLENILNPNSCWNKATHDEPVFVLRSTDYQAPAAVIAWANRYVMDKGGWVNMSEAQRTKYFDALAVAQAMRDFNSKIIDDDIPF